MSYNAQEISRESGSPVELYDITIGSESWHLSSGEDTFTIDMVDYTPLAITRDPLPVGAEERTAELGLTLPASHPFVQKYRLIVPGTKAFITIRRLHRDDMDEEVISMFKGVVSAVAFINNGATARIGVAPFSDGFKLPMPRYVYSGLCNNVLGDRWCKADLETGVTPDEFAFAYKYVGSVTSVVNVHNIVAGIATVGYPDNFFQAGRILTAAGDQRLIIHQTGNNIFVYVPLFEGADLVGHNVTLYAGCDHAFSTCESKFNNSINYGGYPYVPLLNPFETGLG